MTTPSYLPMEDENEDVGGSTLLLEEEEEEKEEDVMEPDLQGVFFLSRTENLSLSVVLLVGCYLAILIPAYSHPDQLAPIGDDQQPPKHLVLLNRSADLLSGPCQPNRGLDRLKSLPGSADLLDIPVFVLEGEKEGEDEEEVEGEKERAAPWALAPPLGLRGCERQAARALASLASLASLHPRPGPSTWPGRRADGGCRRCVVVGSGGVLHDSHLGSHIDQYDIIIRLNGAPVRGFQRDAGSRTTIRLVYPEAAPTSPDEYRDTGVVALVVFKSLDLDWLTSVVTKRPLSFWSKLWFWRTVVEEIPLNAEHFRILNPEIVHQTGRALHSYTPDQGKRLPTLGACAVVLALQLCDHVSLAGFGYDMQRPQARLHYYEALRMGAMKAQVVHDIGSEKLFLRDLVSSGAVADLTGAL